MDLKEFKTESKGVKNNGEADRNHNAKGHSCHHKELWSYQKGNGEPLDDLNPKHEWHDQLRNISVPAALKAHWKEEDYGRETRWKSNSAKKY